MIEQRTRDTGLTLTELVITVAILGIMTVTVAAAVGSFLRNQDGASNRIDRTRGLQQLVNHLPADVASSQRIEVSSPWTNPCSSIGVPVLNLIWGESFPGADPISVSVTYVHSTDGTELARNYCGPDGRRSVIVARGLSGVRVELGSTIDGQVDLILEYDDEERRLTARSRNR